MGDSTEDGLIASRHGLGTFVADDAAASTELERLAADAADSARASGVDPRDLARAIYTGSGAAPIDSDSMPSVDTDERVGRQRAPAPDRSPRSGARLVSRGPRAG